VAGARTAILHDLVTEQVSQPQPDVGKLIAFGFDKASSFLPFLNKLAASASGDKPGAAPRVGVDATIFTGPLTKPTDPAPIGILPFGARLRATRRVSRTLSIEPRDQHAAVRGHGGSRRLPGRPTLIRGHSVEDDKRDGRDRLKAG
jgi:hypothetical protein